MLQHRAAARETRCTVCRVLWCLDAMGSRWIHRTGTCLLAELRRGRRPAEHGCAIAGIGATQASLTATCRHPQQCRTVSDGVQNCAKASGCCSRYPCGSHVDTCCVPAAEQPTGFVPNCYWSSVGSYTAYLLSAACAGSVATGASLCMASGICCPRSAGFDRQPSASPQSVQSSMLRCAAQAMQ